MKYIKSSEIFVFKPFFYILCYKAVEGQDDQNQDLTLFVQNLLKEMQGRFQTMSDSIINRIDDMGARIDDLEKSISELIQEAGAEDAGASTTAGTAPRPATGS